MQAFSLKIHRVMSFTNIYYHQPTEINRNCHVNFEELENKFIYSYYFYYPF